MFRTRKVLVAMSIICAATSCAFAADHGDELMTDGFLNGRGWVRLIPELKVMYPKGLLDGCRFSAGVLSGGDKFEKVFIPRGVRMDEIGNGVDIFYSDPANINVPVLWAVKIFKMRLDGKPKDEIERETGRLRKLAGDLQQGD